MSKKTAKYALTYPESTDHTRTWEWWQSLAQDTETALNKYTAWTYVGITGSVNLPANQDYGVGPCSMLAGGNVLNGQNDGVNAKVPGVFMWSCLFYIPDGSALRVGYANPPNDNAKAYLTVIGGGGTDRFSLSGVAQFTAAGQQNTWGQRSATSVGGCTFNARGIFFPMQPA